MTSPEIPEKHDRIVWIDLEMTGLDPDTHTVVEVAAIITDGHLDVVGEGIDLVVHANEEELERMDDFVTNMHASSGLTDEIRSSHTTLEQAEDAVLELIGKHCSSEHPPLLAGNSIATDRSFIRKQMPRLDKALHYRMIDVSTVKELSRRWFPRAYYNQPGKGMAHRALADIIESIRELDYYRRCVFAAGEGPTSEETLEAKQQATDAYSSLL